MSSHNIRILSALVVLGFLLAGCSTKKKGFVNRNYHAMTTKYNGYWNGRESVREGVKKLEKDQLDDYEQILPVFPLGDAKGGSPVTSEMDRGIEKASMVIGKHSMLIKGKEYNRWIDDSYMLIGQSHYYKRDHLDALEIFNYVVKQYKTEKIRFDGYNWLIRTNTALARFKDAETMMTQLEEDDKLIPKKLRPEIATSKADYYINNGEYGKAKDQLQFAIKNHKRKKNRIRYTFILAQLYTELGMKDSAVYAYNQVLKKSTPYDMEFNARINRALLTSAKSGNVDAIKRELVKMSKDDKNVDYLDRIYFALGNIALDEEEKDLALDYLLKSVAASTKNMGQKAVSFYTIGDLYFDKPEYVIASAYYDSSMAILPERHKDYKRVKGRQESLADLVKNIRTIAYQDSMLKLGNMSDSEREAYIESLIEEVRAKEEQRKADEAAAALNPQLTQTTTQPSLPGGAGGSGWYFYNTTAVGYGISDFRQKWGDRKLEDNWRRSVKTANIETAGEGEGEAAVDATLEELMNPEYYTKNIPVTPAQKDSAHTKIQYAFYDIGTIYKEKLQEVQRSIDAFEELMKRYPKGLFPAETCYQLYRLYTQQGNTAKANEYKNKLLREYPDSEYAKMLSDPDYQKKQEALRARLAAAYDRSFTNNRNGDHELVIATADSMLRLLKEDKLRPKFALLRAMSIGATQKLTVYRKALEDVIRDYPAAPEKVKAEELLGYVKTLMGEVLPDEAVKEDTVVVEEGYVFDLESNHYFAMVVNKPLQVADIKGRVSNFSARMFSTENLTTKNVQLSSEQELVFVQGFPSTKKATDYITALVTDQEFFQDLNRSKLQQFLISEKNFTVFYKKKNVEEYMEFFRANYK